MITFDSGLIDLAAGTIRQRIKTGELSEAWEIAQELAAGSHLSSEQQQNILRSLDPAIQKQLYTGELDDFDLIYEQLLQLISSPFRQ